jgi:hypothetical protein
MEAGRFFYGEIVIGIAPNLRRENGGVGAPFRISQSNDSCEDLRTSGVGPRNKINISHQSLLYQPLLDTSLRTVALRNKKVETTPLLARIPTLHSNCRYEVKYIGMDKPRIKRTRFWFAFRDMIGGVLRCMYP